MEEYNHRPSALAYFTALAEIVSVDLGGLHRALKTNETEGIGMESVLRGDLGRRIVILA